MSARCSETARQRDDPALGTAPPQAEWLLVEHPGPWPVTAPFGAGVPDDLLRRLGHPGVRTVLVRRHGRQPDGDAPRSWFRLRDGTVRTGRWEQPDDLLRSLDPTAGEAHAEDLVLVCTHGVHDVCCAVAGRPVAAALSARRPSATWECSHLGGDRFAATVLLLPDRACYGRLTADTAVATVEAHLAGAPEVARLRGVAGLHPAEQVSLAAVLDRWGPAPVGAARPALLHHEGDLDDGRWTVEVLGRPPLPSATHVVVRSSRRAEALLTCRAQRPTRAAQWDVESVGPPAH